MSLIKEKSKQAINILNELNLDLWLTFVRETSGVRDPVLDFLIGPRDLTWQSALIFTKSGERIAIVGNLEKDEIEGLGVFDTVFGYDKGIRDLLRKTIDQLSPEQIAINTSKDNVHADGLTHAMYGILQEHLQDAPYADRMVSAEPIVNALRGRKTATEVERVRKAVAITNEIYAKAFAAIKPGMTEKELAANMHAWMAEAKVGFAWPPATNPAVNSGTDSPVGHYGPSNIKIERGHLVHFNFGVKTEDYCSDIQRVVYVLRENETTAPDEVQHGFDTIRKAVEAARAVMKPGITGREIDEIARTIVPMPGTPNFPTRWDISLGALPTMAVRFSVRFGKSMATLPI